MIGSSASLRAATVETVPGGPLTLDEATRLALANDPELERLSLEDEAAAGQVDQASQRPNPVIGADVENFLGSGPYRGVDSLEVTLGVSQVIETANKRALRTRLAERERSLVHWDVELRRATLSADVRQAFFEALVAQETLQLRREQSALAQETLAETTRLVEAARAPDVNQARARLTVRQADFALAQAQRALDAATAHLALLWGQETPKSIELAGQLNVEVPPALESLAASLEQTVFLARYESEQAAREAALELERARARPDVEVSGAARYSNEDDGDAAFIVGVKVPWPLFDKNAGNIRSARARLRAVHAEREATRRSLMQELTAAHLSLAAAYADIQTLDTALRPEAERSFDEIRRGYEQGRYSMLEVIDARGALFEVREAQLDALARYAAALAEVTALTQPATAE